MSRCVKKIINLRWQQFSSFMLTYKVIDFSQESLMEAIWSLDATREMAAIEGGCKKFLKGNFLLIVNYLIT